jgi:hypothetical protein
MIVPGKSDNRTTGFGPGIDLSGFRVNQDLGKIDGYLSRFHPRNSSNDSLTSSMSFPS